MAQITVKYKIGDEVVINHATKTAGIVTGIIIRGKGRIYEVGYTGDNGPTGVNCDECELTSREESKLGF